MWLDLADEFGLLHRSLARLPVASLSPWPSLARAQSICSVTSIHPDPSVLPSLPVCTHSHDSCQDAWRRLEVYAPFCDCNASMVPCTDVMSAAPGCHPSLSSPPRPHPPCLYIYIALFPLSPSYICIFSFSLSCSSLPYTFKNSLHSLAL